MPLNATKTCLPVIPILTLNSRQMVFFLNFYFVSFSTNILKKFSFVVSCLTLVPISLLYLTSQSGSFAVALYQPACHFLCSNSSVTINVPCGNWRNVHPVESVEPPHSGVFAEHLLSPKNKVAVAAHGSLCDCCDV